MDNENLKLWNSVEKTNPKHTKKANVRGNRITAIAPQYQIYNATAQFGEYGKSWGFRRIDLNTDLAEKFNLIVFKGTFFFPGGEFEITSSIKLFIDNDNKRLDSDFAKKVETDALTKALSKLGFNADVFMGRYDDHKYVEYITSEFDDENKKKEAETSKPKQSSNPPGQTQASDKKVDLATNDQVELYQAALNSAHITDQERFERPIEKFRKLTRKQASDKIVKIQALINKRAEAAQKAA